MAEQARNLPAAFEDARIGNGYGHQPVWNSAIRLFSATPSRPINLFIGTSNELGGFESGAVAHWFGPAIGHTIAMGAMISVVSGGVGTLLVVAAIALLWPEIRNYGRLEE